MLRLTALLCCWVLVLSLAPPSAPSSESSCLGEVEPSMERYLHYAKKRLPLVLETSPRISHRLATEVFRLFLVKALGYQNVKIELQRLHDVQSVVRRLSGLENKGETPVPDTMVNLEVWVPPNIDMVELAKAGSVSDCGSISFPGRYGWFIPSSIFNFSAGMNDWRYFTDPTKAQTFNIDGENLEYIKKLAKKDSDSYYCNSDKCKDGLYTPSQCLQDGTTTQTCALLLAPYPEETSFLVKDIERLGLYVRVAWLGPRLAEVVNALLRPQVALLLVIGIPGDVPTEGLTNVAMPPCQSDQEYCHYELQRLTKLAWSKMAVGATTAFEALERLQFDPYHYDQLISLYRELGDVGSAACSWMQRNNETWMKWTPLKTERKVLVIGGIFPISGSSYTSKGIACAAQMAFEAVNNNDSILPDYKLELKVDNGQCQGDVVMKTFIDYVRFDVYRNLVGILGPACSDTVEPLAGITRHFKTVVISYSAEGASFSDREKYPYFFRTIGENKQYTHVYPQLLEKLNWHRVATLTEDGQKYTEYIAHLQDELQTKHNIFVFSRKFPRERHPRAMHKYLEEIKNNNVRVIIVDVYDQAARDIMCEAYRLKMTARQGYVWFLPLWLSPKWYTTYVYNSTYNNTSGIRDDDINCTTAEMLEAVNGHLSLSHAYFAPDNDFMQEGRTVGEWRDNYVKTCEKRNIEPSNYGGYAYDAVWTYAYALHKLALENETYLTEIHFDHTTRRFVKFLETTDFEGVSGRVRFMGGGPSRVSNIHVVQWLNNFTHVVGIFRPYEHTLSTGEGRLELNLSAIEWFTPDGKPPVDWTEPPAHCVLSGLQELLNVSCDVAIVVANIIGFGLLGLLLIIVFFNFKRRYEMKVRQTENYMKSWGIDLLVTSDLDKWEIPRDHVVINRKLGEGAFGTVYGGEAHFTDKGWVAVAVKTLKVGSTTEEKLDFLSEAEVMKRFEHKNIVKLLGVCTKNEPVYTVMEFMLYGDLKTYLLARRHLVNDKITEESDDISSKKLTCMALDVARALSYLAQLKYVHRDVASRNCLVNAARTVKLGDFGMTRAMFENDYYKFNRKGMLPVRWMAPESLELGIFTPASDVWSYGVLLYEIITFGSFPFQGLSNSEVLEFVKTGNTLDVPSGVRPQLEGLIRSCWNRDYKRRPNASEIVEFLANNPRLIAPCLDAPAAAVQTDDAGSALGLGMVLPSGGGNSLRKFSLPPAAVSGASGPIGISVEDSGTASLPGGVREPLLNPSGSASSLVRYVSMQRGDSQYCDSDLQMC